MISNKEQNFISVVVYVHNNEKEIGYFLENINNKLNENFEKYEIICVNDKSTDRSVNEVEKVSKKIANSIITIVDMSFYQGREMAMNAGIDLSIGDFVYEFDNVFIDYELDTIIKVYEKCLEGYDIVSTKSNEHKRITSSFFYTIFNKNTNNMYKINSETFRILSRRAINRVKSMNETIPYRKAVYANCGLKLSSILYKSTNSTKREKISNEVSEVRKGIAINSIILFTDVFYKFTVTMSAIMMVATIVIAIYTLCIFICSKPIDGWTTIMLFLSFAFFGIFSILTIMIKYLSIIIDLIFKKQKYIIESIRKMN